MTGMEVTDIAKKMTGPVDRRLAIAPMMDWTDRHCRFFHRLLTRHALIYTAVITTGPALPGDRARLLPGRPPRAPGPRPGRAPGGLAARPFESSTACARCPHRRRFRLRRDQPQRRLPLGPRAGRPLRRLPDG